MYGMGRRRRRSQGKLSPSGRGKIEILNFQTVPTRHIPTVMADLSPTQRFSDRVENYVRYRPSYPREIVTLLQSDHGLSAKSAVADLGSGTGISAALFLQAGCTVHAVEPNREMREAAEKLLGHHAHFHSVAGSAEATTLQDHSMDFVAAAQAFHWFDASAVRKECARILKPGGWFSVSDIFAFEAIAPEYSSQPDLVAECWAGAVTKDIYLDMLQSAGFVSIRIAEESAQGRQAVHCAARLAAQAG